MAKFIPYVKLSKKKQREKDQQARRDWGLIKPVTRKIGDSRTYKLEKAIRKDSSDNDGSFS